MLKKVIVVLVTGGSLLLAIMGCVLSPMQVTRTPSPTPTVGELIAKFSSPDVNERTNAANQAGWYWNHTDADKKALLPYLVEALSDPHTLVRMYAAQSIARLGVYDEHAVSELISWLDEEGHSDRELIQAMQTLRVFAEYASEATPGLIRVIMDPPFSPPGLMVKGLPRAL